MRLLSNKRGSSYLPLSWSCQACDNTQVQEVPAFVIKNNMRVIGMGREEYFELLQMA